MSKPMTSPDFLVAAWDAYADEWVVRDWSFDAEEALGAAVECEFPEVAIWHSKRGVIWERNIAGDVTVNRIRRLFPEVAN